MRVVARTEVGLVREHNEDDWLADEQRRVFVVADGLGGHAAGDVASRTAVRSLDHSLDALDVTSASGHTLSEALHAAHEAVLEAAAADPSRSGMGTTAVVAYFTADERVLSLAHVGDSRAYLVRGERLSRLTADHRTPGVLGGLTQALGLDEGVAPAAGRVELEPGDRVLLCTDGLTDMVDEGTITAILVGGEPAEQCGQRLIDESMARGGVDNVTLILVDVEG